MRDSFRSSTRFLASACALALLMGASGDAQVSIVEINPTQSTLQSSDPDGASGGRVKNAWNTCRKSGLKPSG